MKSLSYFKLFFFLLFTSIIISFPSYSFKQKTKIPPSRDLLLSWNEQILNMAIAEDRLLTLKGVRTAAMTHIAIHDALNAIESYYTSYVYHEEMPEADPQAAAAQAAYAVTVSQFPDQQENLHLELNKWLAGIEDEESKAQGIALGNASAKAILDAREGDKWNGEAEYIWHPMAPGVYAEFNEHSGTPEGFVFGAGWAKARPFTLVSQDQFRSPPPPQLKSKLYTEAFNEVKEVGRTQSESRNEDQAHIAMWWKDFVENSHNRLLRDLVKKENIEFWTAARTFALMNMAIYDAYVNVFDNKFHYNHWRPYTAIRWAANDENPHTEPDTGWDNLHRHTYAFPSYPSAHGCASAAAMTVLANTLSFGDEFAFTMHTPEVDAAGPMSEKIKIDPPTRSFDSFSEAAKECAMSRLYLGIHFRYDSVEGYVLGKKIGEYASDNFLAPLD